MSLKVKIVGVIVLMLVVSMLWQLYRPLPDGISVAGVKYEVPARSVEFLADRTFVDQFGKRQVEQEIFDEVIAMIGRTQEYVLIDMFLFNSWQGEKKETTRALADELTVALIDKKHSRPEIEIVVISDPINTVYGGVESRHFETLEENGVKVILTDLTKLRDSNSFYSLWWRSWVRWFGSAKTFGTAPNPFADDKGDKTTLRSWLSLLNFKANHRKLIIADEFQSTGEVKMVSLITSANPHNGSSAHSNVAVKVKDKLWQDVMLSEQAVGGMSGTSIGAYDGKVSDDDGEVIVQLLTEGKIREKTVDLINQAGEGDGIDMTMFYLSERSVIDSLVQASKRGVEIRLVLDPNKDAFGRTKNGVPNRPVAYELIDKSDGDIRIRWCDTHGEQCHSKMVLFDISGTNSMILGSANLTRRNIGDFNLETNVLIQADENISALADARAYFEEIWNNNRDKIYTTDYKKYADDSGYKKWLYYIQETTGLSSF